ncbi:hypothetical protein [Methylomagnum sp.]
MIALEIEAPIINHRVEISSDQLPAYVARAKLIVMYEEKAIVRDERMVSREGALAEFRANPLKVKTFIPLSREEANAR